MTRVLGAILVLCLTAFAPAWAANDAQEHLPAEYFGRLPEIETIALSAKGTYAATIQGTPKGKAVFIYRLDQAAKPKMFQTGEWIPERIVWGNDSRLLVALVGKGNLARLKNLSLTRTISVDAQTRDHVVLFGGRHRNNFNQHQDDILHLLPEDPDHVLMPSNDSNGNLNIYKVDITDGSAPLEHRGNERVVAWLVDRTGAARVRWEQRVRLANEDIWKIKARNSAGDWVDLPEGLTPVRWSEQPNLLYVSMPGDKGLIGLHAFDVDKMEVVKTIFSNGEVDAQALVSDPLTWQAQAVTYTLDFPLMEALQPKARDRMKQIEAALPSFASRTVISSTWDGSLSIIRAGGPGRPWQYYLFNEKTGRVSLFGHAYPWLYPFILGKVGKVTYQARDGLAISAYLTLPPGAGAKGLPMVVLPHGGPEARDTMTFDYWAQFLANRGYAVFQPNFRGSGGFGNEFAQMGYGEWGGKMQDDITDGTRALIEQGIADPKRICIVGGSYGGYAALMGAVKEPDLYRCAVSYAGPSDLAQMLHRDKKFSNYDYFEKSIGRLWHDREKLDAASPALHANTINAPILLVHGEKDGIVLLDQSKLMARALRRADKPHKFVKLDGEDHYLSRGETRIAFLKEIDAWLAEHLGPGVN